MAVVGGGIGGLAAALSLLEAGCEVQVFEQAPALTEVGAADQTRLGLIRLFKADLGIRQQSAIAAAPLSSSQPTGAPLTGG